MLVAMKAVEGAAQFKGCTVSAGWGAAQKEMVKKEVQVYDW